MTFGFVKYLGTPIILFETFDECLRSATCFKCKFSGLDQSSLDRSSLDQLAASSPNPTASTEILREHCDNVIALTVYLQCIWPDTPADTSALLQYRIARVSLAIKRMRFRANGTLESLETGEILCRYLADTLQSASQKNCQFFLNSILIVAVDCSD